MYIVFKKCNKDFCLATNICVFYVYNLLLQYRNLGEGSGLGAWGGGTFWDDWGKISVLPGFSFRSSEFHNIPQFREITLVRNFSFTCWLHFKLYNTLLSDFRFCVFLHCLSEVNTEITMHYKSTKKIKNKINYISHERWNVRSDQRSLGFRVGHCQVQLTGVDIYAAIIMLISFFVHLISFISDF